MTPPADRGGIRLSIGEPQHATPPVVIDALAGALDGLSSYPTTAGSERLREAIAGWCTRRWSLAPLDPAQDVLPVNGSREALFAFAQAVVEHTASQAPVVVMPNPFYQIYEGAAFLAGATPHYLPCLAENGFNPDFDAVPLSVWQRTQILFLCSPGNPTGALLPLETLKKLIALRKKDPQDISEEEAILQVYREALGM